MGEVVTDEHDELVAEIPDLEKLSAQARLERAKERRLSQLRRWDKRVDSDDIFPPAQKKQKASKVKFQPNITLIEAAARNDSQEVEYLIKNGFSCDLQNEDGLSALHQAVIEDCEDVVHTLVEHGASLNIKDADLWTPLHAAVACGNYDLVSYLVDKGASLVEINADGNMPIDLCEDNEEIEKLLDSFMAKEFTEEELENLRNAVSDEMLEDLRDSVINKRDLTIADERGATAMHIAAANGYMEVLEYLLEHDVTIDVKDGDGWQAIHAAACWGQRQRSNVVVWSDDSSRNDKAIELLFQHGADLDARTNLGETPFDLTEDDELVEMMKELKQNGRKTKELKRSQSNSSRTLCVRRSSIVDKHRMSLDDAKKEGMILQASPDYKEVFLSTDKETYSGRLKPLEFDEHQQSSEDKVLRKTVETPVKNEEKELPKVVEMSSVSAHHEEKVPLETPGNDRQSDQRAAPTSGVTITIQNKQAVAEFKKETSDSSESEPTGSPSRTSISEESAPIAKRESDVPRTDAQSHSHVTISVEDSPVTKKETENSPNNKNTATNKLRNTEPKVDTLPKKKCCVIL